jgi:hypothetical protein
MPEYRSYSLEQNGHVVRSRIHLTPETDDIAIEHAQKLIDGRWWRFGRKIGSLPLSIAATAPEVLA